MKERRIFVSGSWLSLILALMVILGMFPVLGSGAETKEEPEVQKVAFKAALRPNPSPCFVQPYRRDDDPYPLDAIQLK